jgi:hypothetical protein
VCVCDCNHAHIRPMPGSSILADDVDVSMQDEEKMASDDADGGEGGEQGQTQHQRGRSSDNENNREAEQEIIRAKREQTASRAEEAMRRLLEGDLLAQFSVLRFSACDCLCMCCAWFLTESCNCRSVPRNHTCSLVDSARTEPCFIERAA